jgi:WD40 repeat protein
MLASGGRDRTIKFWDHRTGELKRALNDGHSINSLVFSPDGKILAGGTGKRLGECDYIVKLWDVHAGVLKNKLYRCSDYLKIVAFSPNGRLLAIGYDDQLTRTIEIWDIKADKIVFGEDIDGVNSVAFSPDGKLLATGGEGKVISLWDTQTWQSTRKLRDSCRITSIAFSSDSKTLASGTSCDALNIWDINTGELKRMMENNCTAFSVAFLSDGKIIASGACGNVKLWDTETGGLTQILFGGKTKTSENVNNVESIAISPDGMMLASGHSDGTVRLWKAQMGKWH